MKGRIATILSLTGVLVAGSAAALVNTQVLHNSTSNNSNNEVLAPDVTSPDPLSGPTSSVTLPDTSQPSTSAPTGTPSPVAGAPINTQAVYEIAGAGTVTLDTAGNQLVVVSATANPGWVVTSAGNDDALHVEAVIESATTRVEFHASLLFGVVSTSVESSTNETTTTGGGDGGTGGNTGTTQPRHHHDDGGSDDGTDDGQHHSGSSVPGGENDD